MNLAIFRYSNIWIVFVTSILMFFYGFQYRFLVDGVWRCDEQQYLIPAVHGMVNNVIFVEEPNVLAPVPHYDPYASRTMQVDDGIPLHMVILS